jgi:hypothetical protein
MASKMAFTSEPITMAETSAQTPAPMNANVKAVAEETIEAVNST